MDRDRTYPFKGGDNFISLVFGFSNSPNATDDKLMKSHLQEARLMIFLGRMFIISSSLTASTAIATTSIGAFSVISLTSTENH